MLAHAQGLLDHLLSRDQGPRQGRGLAAPALAPHGVRYLCRGTANTTFKARLKQRVMVSEFPSLDQAIAAHNGPSCQEALEALGDGAVRDIRIIEGLE
jgi:uncharacterized protein (DUF1330 family)